MRQGEFFLMTICRFKLKHINEKEHQNKAWSITEHDTMQWCNLPDKPCSPNGQMMTSSSYPFFRFVFHRLLTEWRSLGRFTLEKGIWRRLITLPIGSIRPRRLAPIWWPAVWEWSSPWCSSLYLWHMAAQRCLHLPWCRWLLCSKHTEVPLLQPPQNLDPKEAILTWAHKVHWKSNPVADQAWSGESYLQYISIDCRDIPITTWQWAHHVLIRVTQKVPDHHLHHS